MPVRLITTELERWAFINVFCPTIGLSTLILGFLVIASHGPWWTPILGLGCITETWILFMIAKGWIKIPAVKTE